MAYEIDGINFSYDYEDLIRELKDDIAEGLINTSTIINVV